MAIDGFLPLISRTSFGSEFNQVLRLVILLTEFAANEIQAWSSKPISFRDIIANETAIEALLKQLNYSHLISSTLNLKVDPKAVRFQDLLLPDLLP